MSLTDLRRRAEQADGRLRHRSQYGVEDGLNSVNATTQPAHSARQGHLNATQRVRGRFNALGRRHRTNGLLHIGEQAGQPGGKEVR